MYKKSLFVFRRDLRLDDNTGLIQALNNSKYVIPCFIYDDNILQSSRNSEFRNNFLNESLMELDEELKKKKSSLQIFKGSPERIIKELISIHKIDAVFLNTDFTNYSLKRDAKINQLCKNSKVAFHNILDFLLHNPNDIKTNEGKPYTIYSHFYKKARQFPVRKILKNSKSNYYAKNISSASIISPTNLESQISGGRNSALHILKNLDKFQDYDKARNYPALDSTTKMSAHNKFGTVSIREVYHAILDALGQDHTLMGEIYWREFFSHILFHFPWAQRKSFKTKFQKIPWSKSEANFEKWSKGITGFPIIDAGMRELNGSGFMHNRVRMIVASFLTKDLHIDWRRGDQYFAKKLVDYDPAVNSGNWQWAASTGCDAVPYFRIFNPWLQQQKFDSDCEYIKRWIPELSGELPKTIHNLWKDFPANLKYPKPMIHHKLESQKTKEIFKSQK
ncbi:cryptochrome/photolyase family protein [Nitrosopumilus sp. S4]